VGNQVVAVGAVEAAAAVIKKMNKLPMKFT